MLTAQNRAALAGVIAASLSEQTLRWVVVQARIVEDFESLVKTTTGALDQHFSSVVEEVVRRYEERGVLNEFVDAVFRVCLDLPQCWDMLEKIVEMLGQRYSGQHQALIARRDNFFSIDNLVGKLACLKPQICVIVCDEGPKGTGVLVGPDLVLTSMHVFEPHFTLDKSQIAATYRVHFDYLRGHPGVLDQEPPAGPRRVRLNDSQWLLAHDPAIPEDGQWQPLSEEQVLELQSHLDFALIRLAEPVGSQPISRWGGPRRGWVDLLEAPRAPTATDNRVVIPQHPNGQPQSIDFGRVSGLCRSQTRLQYTTSTAAGSSGAPCFNRDFRLIGIHNAAYNPLRQPVAQANQAIRLDAIHHRIQALVAERVPAIVSPPVRLWNLCRVEGEHRPVIGREVLLDWIEQARLVASGVMRLFASEIPDTRAGRTFSLEILEYSLRDTHDHVCIAFGAGRHAMPDSLEDLVHILGTAFKIPSRVLCDQPSRPTLDARLGSTDDDKLLRWASQTLPNWFARMLQEHLPSQQDTRELARRVIDQNRRANQASDPQTLALAEQPNPVWADQWRLGWIAFDDPGAMAMIPEIKGFLAAMIGVGLDEQQLPSVLGRLRWMFFGSCPDFLIDSQPVIEELEPILAQSEIDTLVASAFDSGVTQESLQLLSVVLSTPLLAIDRAQGMSNTQALASNLLQCLLSHGVRA
ncbi:trypsin-like serine peptidase [Pseudomonas soli]|uniref:trypsin-like serine peptidase n=1 Tax=Pseudomonas soli TaxID=1306993 RepID=UPI003D0776C2